MRTTRQITVETHSITLIKTRGANVTVYCEQCREPVTTFAPEQLASVLQLDIAEVCRRVQAKQIHLTNIERGAASICSKSLSGIQGDKLEKRQ